MYTSYRPRPHPYRLRALAAFLPACHKRTKRISISCMLARLAPASIGCNWFVKFDCNNSCFSLSRVSLREPRARRPPFVIQFKHRANSCHSCPINLRFFLLTKILIVADLGSCYKNKYEKSGIRERASTFYIMRLTARVLGSVVRGCRLGQCRK
ncbi:unnamed protein product [Trichogramma brassicae]|uniref:Uncharacterized protein n=1 Tax=Trichogramma brassicae TaxID=86971 RepID=A0A6H5J4J8_9HYME|nr:unnamed protein product [Trichogramma brassicae]